MEDAQAGAPVARTTEPEVFRMLGGPLELVASIEPPAGDAVMFRSRMEPGSMVPLHSHSDPECFLVLGGEIEAFADDGRGWRILTAGRSVSMENGMRHSVRAGAAGADLLVATNHRLARFFRDARRPDGDQATSGPPSAEEIATVLDVARRYGYWMASPEEHGRVTGQPLNGPEAPATKG